MGPLFHKYLSQIKNNPRDPRGYYNMGEALLNKGYPQEAVGFLRKSLLVESSFNAHFHLGKAYSLLSCYKLAGENFEKAFLINPDHKENRHLYFSLNEKKIDRAHSDYVKVLFDSYAEGFDEHLEKLNYKTPFLLGEFLKKFKTRCGHVLDLGCGTGLMGLELGPFSSSITGVDLSPKMLERALKKKIYKELIENDLLDYLDQTEKTFDLVILGDTVPYFGPLDDLFKKVKKVLNPHGCFFFSAEKADIDWKLSKEGRFKHSQIYLDNLSCKFGFSSHFLTLILREEKGKEVQGVLFGGFLDIAP